MAVQYAPSKLKVPPGFQNILEGLAREVLREQPENIIEFSANYFKSQLAVRSETGQDDARKGANMEKLERGEDIDIDLNNPSTEQAATKIQAAFRGHQSRKESRQLKQENEAATKIQAGFRGHQTRKDLKERSGDHEQQEKEELENVDKDGEEKKSVEIPSDDKLEAEKEEYNDEKYDQAATKIQAGFRGYKTREEMKSKSEENFQQEIEGEEDGSNEKSEEEAALKIQASFRGHMARQKVEAMKSSKSVPEDNANDEQDNVDDSITGGNIEDKKIDETANADLINEAATKIQSSYRGYAVRQNYSKKSQNIVENDVVEGDKSIEEAANDDVDANMANEAAIKIQSSYRGFADRKKYKALTDPSKHNKEDDLEVNKNEEAAIKIQAGYRGYVARKEVDAMKNSKNIEDPATDNANVDLDAKKSEDAAVKIQASYRGFAARKEVEAMKNSKSDEAANQDDLEAKRNEDAALKIQAGYRGYAARKEVAAMKSSKENEDEADVESEKVLEGKADDSEEQAAIKIQASYRGYKTRASLRSESPSQSTNEKPVVDEEDGKGKEDVAED